jgi:hypothetical protein
MPGPPLERRDELGQEGELRPCFSFYKGFPKDLINVFSVTNRMHLKHFVVSVDLVDDPKAPCPERVIALKLCLQFFARIRVAF